MQVFFDTILSPFNTPVAGAQVFVYQANGTLATIYDANVPLSTTVLDSSGAAYYISEDLLSPISNPIVTGADGKYLFFAANGVYTVTIVSAGYDNKSFEITLNDPSVSPFIPLIQIVNGGTGQTTQTTAFNALAPTTTKGDLIANDGTDNVRLAAGANNQLLIADSTSPNGVKWDTPNGFVFVGSSAASGSAAVITDLDFTNNNYIINLRGFKNDANAAPALLFQVSFDNGSTFSSSGYVWSFLAFSPLAGSITGGNTSGEGRFSAALSSNAPATYNAQLHMQKAPLLGVSVNAQYGELWVPLNALSMITGMGSCYFSASANAPDAVKLYFSSGSISSGFVDVYREKRA
jgi:hypothetical protein